MDKQHILSEIKRTAEENAGVPLGESRFQQETGIQRSDWYGKYWARWGDALIEAGHKPNVLQSAYSDDYVIEKLVSLIRELGHYPVAGELRLKARNDKGFPSLTVFSRIDKKADLAQKVITYCREREGMDDIIGICKPIAETQYRNPKLSGEDTPKIGYVYLMKSGRYYKIGMTLSIGMREYTLSLQLPEKLTKVHVIKTDDPVGIERYWHQRFKDKRKKGEWFDLSAKDVKTFKRRKFM